MREKLNDGGPAFATIAVSIDGEVYHQSGMSLRDWFAGQALAHALNIIDFIDDTSAGAAARYSYDIADAMLAAREPK